MVECRTQDTPSLTNGCMTKHSSLHHHRNGQAALAGAFTGSVTPADAGNSQDRFATQSYQAANLAALNDGVWDTGNAAFADPAADDEAEYDPHKDLVCYDTDDEPMEESDLTDSRLRAGDDWGRHRLYVNPLSNGHQQAPGYPDGVLLATHRDGRTVPYVHNTTLRPFDCGFFVHADFMANSAVLGISAEGFMFELGCREANLLHSGR
jgi:hypothetical protein